MKTHKQIVRNVPGTRIVALNRQVFSLSSTGGKVGLPSVVHLTKEGEQAI